MMKRKIQLRRGTAQEWENKNPVLAAGEPGVEIDTGHLKIGDGETAWNDLDYLSGEGEEGGMEVHGNEYHEPEFASTEYVDQSVFSGSYNDLTDVPSEFTPEEHGNEKHSITFEDTANKGQPNGYASLDGDGLVPEGQLPEAEGMEEHGNEYHDPNFATESALNDKADDPHGNEAHSDNYATTTGTYSNLRAQGTTKGDVGLGNVENHRQARSPNGYTIQKNGSDSWGIINFKT